MNKENAETRNRLKNVCTVTEFEDILNQAMISDEDRELLIMHYKERKPLSLIADTLGLSEIAIKKRHHKILIKVGKLFN